MTPVAAPRELVLASAGSGKTFRISSRLISLLARGEDPDRILAATFTRKAAGQILDRVLTRLASAASSEDAARELSSQVGVADATPGAATPEFWAGVLERTVDRLHRFNVGTLDSFFIRAATSFAFELGLAPGWRIPDLPAFRRLRSRALLDVLRGVERQRLLQLLRLASRGDSRRSVHEHVAGMMEQLVAIHEQLDPEIPDPWSAFRRSASDLDLDVEDAEALTTQLEALPLPITKNGTSAYPWVKAVRDVVNALKDEDWARVGKSTLCERVASGELVYGGHPIDDATRELIERVLRMTRAQLRPRLASQIEALGRLTEAFERRLRALQRSEGLFSFTDVTRLIGSGDPLGARADLYYRLDARTHHVLLDEFQDTSLPQWEALEPIVDEVLSDDARAAVIVADPKQSIYGWRGAEPTIVHAIANRYGLERDYLDTSYRSSPVILDFVNRIFRDIATNPVLTENDVCAAVASEWSADFKLHEAHKKHLPGYVALEVGPADEGRGSQRPALYRFAAERVAELRARAPGFSIGVLTRTNAAVARLYLELRRLDVEVSQEGGTPLTDSGACEAMLALLRLADHPADTIARYHVASSPLGSIVGVTDHRDEVAAETAARDIRSTLLTEGYGRTISGLARRIVPHCDRREARRLTQLAELAHRYDANATLRPGDFVRLVEAQRVEDRATADVRVMTVHQAKGLEFDLVVLPQLDDSIFKGGRPAPAIPYREGTPGRITAVFPAVNKELRCLFPELNESYRQRQGGVLRDALSTLYVGLTRARYALHAIICPDGISGPGKGTTPSRIMREAIRDPGTPLSPATHGSVLFEGGDPAWYSRPHATPERDVREPDVRAPIAPPVRLRPVARGRLFKRQSPSGLHAGSVDVKELLRLDNAEALDRGSLVHAWFEQIEWLDDGLVPREEWLEIARRVAPDLPETLHREILSEFHGWLAIPATRGALIRSRYPAGAQVHRELPFIRRHGESLMEGVIDRVVISYNGGRPIAAEILDFKTDRTSAGAGRVMKLAELYQPQLAAYADAVAEMYMLPRDRCSAALIFLEAGRVVDVGV